MVKGALLARCIAVCLGCTVAIGVGFSKLDIGKSLIDV